MKATEAHLYQQTLCRVKTNEGFPGQFISTMEVNYGCTQSPTLFGLCVDQLGK